DVALARNRHVHTVLYVVYSGHGNVDAGEAYLSLEDARIFGKDLDTLIFDRVGASEYHVIVDACYSSLLATARGPGGKRRAVRGFSQSGGIRPRDNVGLLFSTGSARESHEWAGVESGVFSHEVRSGLYGAADANGDGVVTYPEIVAFVERANAAIPAERFRPDVFARAPLGSSQLLDLRPSAQRQIEIVGQKHAHYQLEDERGVQIAEFHNDARQTVRLVRPATSMPLFLKRVDDDAEFALPSAPDIVRVAELEPEAQLVASRGAATSAYGTLFTLSFGPEWVHPLPREAQQNATSDELSGIGTRGWVEIGLFGVGAASITGGILAAASAGRLQDQVTPSTSQAHASEINRDLVARRWQEGLGFFLGGAAIAGGITVLAWPTSPATVQVRAGASRLDLLGTF
ncbi:MAG TPA: hypothetical protein VNW92_18705, partial [Polyangiaceae bacterium]|nr:hypothetical protein [Polyangiaceae bacterium]